MAAGTGSGAGADGDTSTERASAGAGSGKDATGAVTAARAAVWEDGAAAVRGAGKSSQSSSPGSTTRPPPVDDRPYSAARRSASAASAAASMGRAGACASCATVGTASAAGAGEISAAFLRPRPPEVDGRPAREAFFRSALDEVCSSPGTDAAAADWPRSGDATGAAPCSPASRGEDVLLSGTAAVFVPAVRRRRGALLAVGTGSGSGADGDTSTKRTSAGAGSGKEATGAVTAERTAVWEDGAAAVRGAGKSSQSSSPGSTTRPPPVDDRPYSAARRSASAASAAASMGRARACCSGATVGTASAASTGGISAAFLRPRTPEVDGRPARAAFFRPALDEGCSSPGTGTDAADRPRSGDATGAAPWPLAPKPSGVAVPLSDGVPASVREILSDEGVFFRLVFRLREDAGSAACFFSRSSAGAFPAGAASCAAFCPFPAVFSDRDGDGSRPQASSNERAVAVMTVTRLRDNRLLVSSPATGDRSGAASEGEDMELLDYIQID